jgi:DNA invertase Pin-like site-specific DNA recombinase
MGHLLGYARISTTDQHPQLQVDALTAAGCYRVFTETASGARTDRPVLEKLKVAQEMYRSGQYTVAAIATTLEVSRASIYRHLTTPDRSVG